MYKVSSEIYKETNFGTTKSSDGKVISSFQFHYPDEDTDNGSTAPHDKVDKDGDLIVQRRKSAMIEIEHSEATELRLVGLQVWRGALLLADFFFHCRDEFRSKQILELGAGVGLTSITAAIYASNVICTDVDIGGILSLIRANVERNKRLITGKLKVLEYDFMQKPEKYNPELVQVIDQSDIVIAADVIYEDDLTDAFIRVLDYIFQRQSISGKSKTIFIALEKRFVFTLSECDTVAPMFEYFIKETMSKPWHFHYIPLDFPQYFVYERCKHLVLIRLTNSQC